MKNPLAVLEHLRADEAPEAIRLINVMERYGIHSPKEAAEWRMRVLGWARWLEIGDSAND